MKRSSEQIIYESMLIIIMKTRCSLHCVMNVRKKELYKELINQVNRNMQKFRSAALSSGFTLAELTVWRELKLYLTCYSYQIFRGNEPDNKVSKMLTEEIRTVKKSLPHIKSNRILLYTQRYLDLLIDYRYKLQASI